MNDEEKREKLMEQQFLEMLLSEEFMSVLVSDGSVESTEIIESLEALNSLLDKEKEKQKLVKAKDGKKGPVIKFVASPTRKKP